MFIPKQLFVTIDMCKESPLGAKIMAAGLFDKLVYPKYIIMATFLLEEKLKGAESKFKHFLNILPTDLSEFPVLFTDEEKEWLNGSKLKESINDSVENLEKDY